MKELQNGWTDESFDTVCHFEHYPLKEANRDKEIKTLVHVVETINWTLANKRTVHRNKYFTYGLPDAIALAATIEIASLEVAEEVVCIRPAEPAEAEEFFSVEDVRGGLAKSNLAEAVAQRQKVKRN